MPTYPHVDGVQDWRAQQSIKLLWDQIIALQGRVSTAETSLKQAQATNAALQKQIDTQQSYAIGQALAGSTLAGSTLVGTGTGGGTNGSNGTDTGNMSPVPDYSAVFQQVHNSLGITAASTVQQKFKYMQTAVWQVSHSQPAGETKIGLLTEGPGAEGTYTCGGVTANYYHIMFDNGGQVDILISDENGAGATWIQLGDVETSAWHAPTDPAIPC